jgi:hypothetical protein
MLVIYFLVETQGLLSRFVSYLFGAVMEIYQRAGIAKITVIVCLFFLAVGGTVYSRQSLKWERVHMATQVVDDTVYLPGHTVLRMWSLGYGPFAADVLFIRTHAYFLKHFYSDRIFKWLDSYVEGIAALDPDLREVYLWASKNVRYGQIIDESVIRRSNHFAELGIERFPDDARLYAHLGFNKYFELKPIYVEKERVLDRQIAAAKSATDKRRLIKEKAQIRGTRYELERSALEDYTTAAMLPNSTVDPLFLVTLYINQNLVDAAAQLAQALYYDTPESGREGLLIRLESMGRSGEAEALRKADNRHMEEMPYIGELLFEMVGSLKELRVPESWDMVSQVYGNILETLKKREEKESDGGNNAER